jgi:hypothetical protein
MAPAKGPMAPGSRTWRPIIRSSCTRNPNARDSISNWVSYRSDQPGAKISGFVVFIAYLLPAVMDWRKSQTLCEASRQQNKRQIAVEKPVAGLTIEHEIDAGGMIWIEPQRRRVHRADEACGLAGGGHGRHNHHNK